MRAVTVSEHPHQPLYPTRILNWIGKIKKTPHLRVGALMDAAERKTGLSNWGVDEFEEPLTRFCEAINQDRRMHFAGRFFFREEILRSLGDRLEIQDSLHRNPEILGKNVEAPIVIPGEARAGTTLLHRLMALDHQFRVPRSWELHFPLPPPDPASAETDPRIQKVEKLYKIVFRTCPAVRITHPMSASWPEECYFLLDRSFICLVSALFNNLPAYWEWFLSLPNEELAKYYRFYKKQLQILQWRYPNPRWVLKSPSHSLALGAYQQVFPDARFIICHRHPSETIPSLCSLSAARQASYYETLDFRGIGKKVVDVCRTGAERLIEARRQIGEAAFFDVSYTALINEPIPTMRSIYQYLGLELKTEVEERIKSYLELQKRGRHRQHRYTLEEFGLNKRGVDEQFEAYIKRFQNHLQ